MQVCLLYKWIDLHFKLWRRMFACVWFFSLPPRVSEVMPGSRLIQGAGFPPRL
jgi:hypothetical protein